VTSINVPLAGYSALVPFAIQGSYQIGGTGGKAIAYAHMDNNSYVMLFSGTSTTLTAFSITQTQMIPTLGTLANYIKDVYFSAAYGTYGNAGFFYTYILGWQE
jgi:hypothetical protein